MPEDFERLLRRYHAKESVDARAFQPRARLLQSIWRQQQGYDPAEYRGKLRGARIPMPWAKETLANYMTPTIKGVVRDEVMDRDKAEGKLYGKPRIFNNLLSSQPLCFNLFGELQQDLDLASRVLEQLSDGRFETVTAIEFEHSPGRGDARYTSDNSAFDVFFETRNSNGQASFIGIEVKYHENLKDEPAPHRSTYDRVADNMGCFDAPTRPRLRERPLQQIWRDHLLAGSMLKRGDSDDGLFVFLSPSANEYCREAVASYQSCLTDERTFSAWSLEDVVDAVRDVTDAEWIDDVWNRYLNFGKIEAHSDD